MKKTKIIATISGKKCTPEFIDSLYRNGMNIVRLNTAHMSVDDLEKMVPVIRSVSDKIGIMLDTKGPNIRTCDLAEPRAVSPGDILRLTGGGETGDDVLHINYFRFVQDVAPGQRVLIDDGETELVILRKEGAFAVCEVRRGTLIRDRKSVNVPDAEMKMPALTEKDRLFILKAAELKIDFIAHSFVRTRDDVLAVRSMLETLNSPIQIIAKIENRQGVANAESILDAADGIMVARGDLGIEIPMEEVPLIQKQLIFQCMNRAKSVITATQMLQSMEENPMPTRAEVSDVANAVFDGSDAVMLSGETAQGKYPAEAVAAMSRIVQSAETSAPGLVKRVQALSFEHEASGYMIHAAVKAYESLPVKAIICNTVSGKTARICAAYRPDIPIFALSHDPAVVSQLSICSGVIAEHSTYIENPLELARASARILLEKGDLNGSDLVVLLSSSAFRDNNLCCIATLDELLQIRK